MGGDYQLVVEEKVDAVVDTVHTKYGLILVIKLAVFRPQRNKYKCDLY